MCASVPIGYFFALTGLRRGCAGRVKLIRTEPKGGLDAGRDGRWRVVACARRLITFYAILAVIGVAVVVFVISKGGSTRRPSRRSPAVTWRAPPAPCIGPAPKPVGGTRSRRPRPTQAAAPGPSFNVLQSGQFVNFTNNQGTLGGKLRLTRRRSRTRRHQPDRERQLRSSGKSLTLDAIAIPGAKGAITGTLGGLPFAAALKSAPPAAGRGGAADAVQHSGHVSICPRRRRASAARSRFTAPEPWRRSTPRTGKQARPAHVLDQDGRGVRRRQMRQGRNRPDDRDRQRPPAPERDGDPAQGGDAGAVEDADGQAGADDPSGLSPAGEKFTATKQRTDFNKLVAAVFLAMRSC